MKDRYWAAKKAILKYLYEKFYSSDDPHGDLTFASTIVGEIVSSSFIEEKIVYATLARLCGEGSLEGKDESVKGEPCWLYKLSALGAFEAEKLLNEFPSDDYISEAIHAMNSQHIWLTWQKALERRATDSEGAITSARTLLEDVCKHILEDKKIEFDERNMDLPKLYRRVANELDLAPDNQSKDVFKRFFGSCQSIVESLATLRNLHSDSHGKTRSAPKTDKVHAELAVNLAGAMASFLIQSWEAGKMTILC